MPAQPRYLLADLRTALACLERDRKSLVHCCSRLEKRGDEYVAMPGTLDKDAEGDVAEYDRAIAAVRDTIERMEYRRQELARAKQRKL